MGITHSKVSAKSDGADTSLVRPSDWNAPHVITTLPTIVGVGSSASGTGDVVPTLPSGHQANDILLLFRQSSNEANSIPTGYTKLGPMSGIVPGPASGATRIVVAWKRDNGSESDPTVVDTGDHTLAQIMAVRGCPTSGDPFLCVGATRKITASTTGTASAGATPIDNCLVVNAWAHSLDTASTVFSSPINSNLANLTLQINVSTTDGFGGGIGVVTGEKASEGGFAATTVTETSTTDVSVTFIMLPAGVLVRSGLTDIQVFSCATANDTWTKPTSAKTIEIFAIGGGGSGGAGRNAATASGGGGGGGGLRAMDVFPASLLPATLAVVAGAGGAATANSDGASGNSGSNSTVNDGTRTFISGSGGVGGGGGTSNSGGVGGNGGSYGGAAAAGTQTNGTAGGGGGTGGTTAAAGGSGFGQPAAGGGGGAGGGTTQAASAGGGAVCAGAGGGGGRANTNVGTGGNSINNQLAGGATAGANGSDSPYPTLGGSGAAGGTSAAGPGGQGGWPGGGGGGGGSQAGAQRGGAGGDGDVVIITHI